MKWVVMIATALTATSGDVEYCFAWAHAVAEADPALDAPRFERAVAACRASQGYVPTVASDVSTSPPSVLVVGEPVAFRPPALPVSVVCDDLSVVRVEDAGAFLWLTGLKPGETSCSFGSAQQAGRRALYHFTVRSR